MVSVSPFDHLITFFAHYPSDWQSFHLPFDFHNHISIALRINCFDFRTRQTKVHEFIDFFGLLFSTRNKQMMQLAFMFSLSDSLLNMSFKDSSHDFFMQEFHTKF